MFYVRLGQVHQRSYKITDSLPLDFLSILSDDPKKYLPVALYVCDERDQVLKGYPET